MISRKIITGLTLLWATHCVCTYAESPTSAPPSAVTITTPPSVPAGLPVFVSPSPLKDSKWNIRVEILMAALPQDQFFHLLPELEDSQKIDGAVSAILAAIQRKEAILTGCTLANLLDGQRATSETILEKLYPSEFVPPQTPQNMGATAGSGNAGASAEVAAMSASFEKRNLGVSLEVQTASVSENGEIIYLNLQLRRVDVAGIDTYQVARTINGQNITMPQPQFAVTAQNTALATKNNRYFLFSTHLLSKPENHVEVFILRAFATSIR